MTLTSKLMIGAAFFLVVFAADRYLKRAGELNGWSKARTHVTDLLFIATTIIAGLAGVKALGW